MNFNHSQKFNFHYVGLAIGILASSTAAIFIRFAQTDAPSISIAALRLSFATILLAPLVVRNQITEIKRLDRSQWELVLASGILLAVHFASWISSLAYTTVASSVVIVATSPMWVSILAIFLLKEVIHSKLWVGLLLALAGTLIVGLLADCQFIELRVVCATNPNLPASNASLGNMLALIGAFCSAGYLIVGRKVRGSISLLSYIFLVYGISAIILLMLAVISESPLMGLKPSVYGWCFLLALIPQLIGHSSFNWALKFVPASIVSIFLLAEPVISTILALFFLREPPKTAELFGGALILTGIYIATKSE